MNEGQRAEGMAQPWKVGLGRVLGRGEGRWPTCAGDQSPSYLECSWGRMASWGRLDSGVLLLNMCMTSNVSLSRELIRSADPLDPKLYFSRIAKWFVCTLEFEKYFSRIYCLGASAGMPRQTQHKGRKWVATLEHSPLAVDEILQGQQS